MNRCTFKILTKKKAGQSHRETEVTIDWHGISVDDLKILAKNAIVQDLQARIRAEEFSSFPENVTIVAKDIVHRESAALWEYQPSIMREVEASNNIDKKLEKMLKKLSPDELRALLA